MYNRMFNSNLDWIMVQSVDQVDKVPVQPSCKAWIMVQNEPVFALRSSDGMGLITTELYRFEKYEPPKAQYITAQELTEALNRLKEDLNESITKSVHAESDNASEGE